MPRQKVHESQRQRAAEACAFCRESKKKCSGSAPCTQCSRRGLAQECFITYLPRGFRSRNNHGPPGAARQSWGSLSQASAISAQDTITAAPPSASNAIGDLSDNDVGVAAELFRPLSPSESREGNEESATYHDPGPAAPERTSRSLEAKDTSLVASDSRMLLSSHGERVYVGGAASIAFLQTVRRVVAGQIGPSDFSHSKESDNMLEVQTPQTTDDALDVGPEQKLQFLQCYFSVTEAFIDIFDPLELEARIAASGNGPLVTSTKDSDKPGDGGSSKTRLSPLLRASLDLVIAIGAQCTSKQDSQSIGRAFFHRAQRQALAEMIQDPDLDMVRTYLLMAFYMLGECRRNTAYMYLSVAARAAIALGLHSPSSYSQKQPPDANDKLRLRVWMTCRVGDKLVNSIIGRPATTVGISEKLDPFFTSLTSGFDHGLDCMIAAYRIVSIIDDINNKLYHEQDVRHEVIEKLLEDIDAWKRDLPPSLRQSASSTPFVRKDSSKTAEKGSVGIMHVSCLYYFAVTLATRPVFISALIVHQRQKDQESPLAEACLQAAMYLAQTCMEGLNAGLLQSNMCIMKALVFAAGLVLGVEMFAKVDANSEIERAFEGAKHVLSFLAARSPQAGHYLDILTSLSNAIVKQRSRMASRRANRYVSKLFSLEPPSSNAGHVGDGGRDDNSWSGMLLDDATDIDTTNFPVISDHLANWPDATQMDTELYVDWETVNISHWDNFPFRA